MLSRIFSLAAAVLLVGAFALAMLGPPDMTLGQALLTLDHTVLARLQGHLGDGTWRNAVVPLLVRPMWLPVAALGLVCAGLALTFNTGKPTQTRRRRS